VIVHGEHRDIEVHAWAGVPPLNVARHLQEKAGAVVAAAGGAEPLRRIALVLDLIDPGTEGVVFAQVVFARRKAPIIVT
jgi:hypothetical protein